ncbi:MAG: hypothetical protein II008_01475 [Oscillospiraceae bacterium]|nr:hypothetical protein [Oscillospiraceae bacterium]
MITLNDLLTIVDAWQMSLVVPVTPKLKARICVYTRNTEDMVEISKLYGDIPVVRVEPVEEGDVMEIILGDRADEAQKEAGL